MLYTVAMVSSRAVQCKNDGSISQFSAYWLIHLTLSFPFLSILPQFPLSYPTVHFVGSHLPSPQPPITSLFWSHTDKWFASIFQKQWYLKDLHFVSSSAEQEQQQSEKTEQLLCCCCCCCCFLLLRMSVLK